MIIKTQTNKIDIPPQIIEELFIKLLNAIRTSFIAEYDSLFWSWIESNNYTPTSFISNLKLQEFFDEEFPELKNKHENIMGVSFRDLIFKEKAFSLVYELELPEDDIDYKSLFFEKWFHEKLEHKFKELTENYKFKFDNKHFEGFDNEEIIKNIFHPYGEIQQGKKFEGNWFTSFIEYIYLQEKCSESDVDFYFSLYDKIDECNQLDNTTFFLKSEMLKFSWPKNTNDFLKLGEYNIDTKAFIKKLNNSKSWNEAINTYSDFVNSIFSFFVKKVFQKS